jgi:hypothetical protein
MKRLFSTKSLVVMAVAVGGLAAVSGAQARSISDAVVSVTIGTPVVHQVQHAPVYVQPAPVYVQPAPVYVQRNSGYRPQRGYDANSPWGDADHDGIANRYDRHDNRNDRRVANNSPWGDADRDGVQNRYDRAPNNPNRR